MAHEAVLSRIPTEIPGHEAALAATFDGAVVGAVSEGEIDLGAQAERYAALVRAHHEAYEALGGIITMGGHDEILITTTKHYILIRPNHGKKIFLAVAIASSGNVGYLRLKMKRYLDEIVRG